MIASNRPYYVAENKRKHTCVSKFNTTHIYILSEISQIHNQYTISDQHACVRGRRWNASHISTNPSHNDIVFQNVTGVWGTEQRTQGVVHQPNGMHTMSIYVWYTATRDRMNARGRGV